jgi:hypothetical protein
MTPARTLLAAAIDYAGTFPPARLELAEALRSYAAYRGGPHAWMLGRFILPADKLDEFEELAPGLLPSSSREPWPLSLIVAAEPAGKIDRLQSFARNWEGKATIASLEVPPLEASRIGGVAAVLPPGPERFFEAPLGADLEARLEAIAACGAGAKVRTGGVSAASFPGTGELSRFLLACARAGVPFKATAGLHHAWRGARSLGGGPEAPEAVMHGYLNLAIAAALVHAGKVGPEETLAVLAEGGPRAFRFRDDGLEWRGRSLDRAEIAAARRRFFRSFGACSFEEPVHDLEASGIA